jgi:predicted aldo/keto reductase-like oxidoreductase
MYDNSATDYLYLTVLGRGIGDNLSYAGFCNECGNASNALKIDIPQHLKEVASDMEGNYFQDKIKVVGLRLDKRKRFLRT